MNKIIIQPLLYASREKLYYFLAVDIYYILYNWFIGYSLLDSLKTLDGEYENPVFKREMLLVKLH